MSAEEMKLLIEEEKKKKEIEERDKIAMKSMNNEYIEKIYQELCNSNNITPELINNVIDAFKMITGATNVYIGKKFTPPPQEFTEKDDDDEENGGGGGGEVFIKIYFNRVKKVKWNLMNQIVLKMMIHLIQILEKMLFLELNIYMHLKVMNLC